MNPKNHLLILIGALIGIIIGLLFIIINPAAVFHSQTAQIIDPLSLKNEKTTANPSIKQTVLLLAQDEFLDMQLNPQGNMVRLITKNGDIRDISFDGKITKPVTALDIPLDDARFSSDGSSLLFKETSHKPWRYHNLITNETKALHAAIKNPVFSQDGKKIAYHFFDPNTEEGNIAVSDANGDNFRILLRTRLRDMTLSWNNDTFISVVTSTTVQELFKLSLTGTFTKLLTDLTRPRIWWSLKGESFALAEGSTDNKAPVTGLYNHEGTLLKELSSLLSAQACAWESDATHLLCAEKGGVRRLGENENTLLSQDNRIDNVVQILLSPLQNIGFLRTKTGLLYAVSLLK